MNNQPVMNTCFEKLNNLKLEALSLAGVIKANILQLEASRHFNSKTTYEFPLIIMGCDNLNSIFDYYLDKIAEPIVNQECEKVVQRAKYALTRDVMSIEIKINIIHGDYVFEHLKSPEFDAVINDLLDTITELSHLIRSPA